MHKAAPIFDLSRRWFGSRETRVEPLVRCGFSGSAVFVVEIVGSGERFVLKPFPESTARARASWIHRLVVHLHDAGCAEVPEVLVTPDGESVVADAAGRYWEVSRFMPGVAVPAPTLAQASAALACLARLHLAAERLPMTEPRHGVPAAISRRVLQFQALLASPWHARRPADRRMAITGCDLGWQEAVCGRMETAIRRSAGLGGPALLDRLVAESHGQMPLQACVRDIWSEHVFFATTAAETVTAVVDLHAAGIDTPATDIVRLLGSWSAPEGRADLPLAARWREAIAAYATVRPLTAGERRLLPLLHATGVVLGLDNWFRWTLGERRVFPAPDRVLARIDALLADLPVAVAWMQQHAGNVD